MTTLLGRALRLQRQLRGNATRLNLKRDFQPRLIFYANLRVSIPWASIAHSFKSFSNQSSCQRSILNAAEKARLLPISGFSTIEADQLVEEEEMPDYRAERFYPVHLGDIFQNRYQVVAKLGFSSCSIIWLARDLK